MSVQWAGLSGVRAKAYPITPFQNYWAEGLTLAPPANTYFSNWDVIQMFPCRPADLIQQIVHPLDLLARENEIQEFVNSAFTQLPIANATGSFVVSVHVSENLLEHLHASSPRLRDLVLRVKSRFGLTMSQTADVLNVSRQTLYDWLDDEGTPNLRRERRIRLHQLAGLATEWGRRQQIPPGRFLDTELGGVSLISALQERNLDRHKIEGAMDTISRLIEAEKRLRRESLVEKLDRLGFTEPPVNQPDALSDFTR